MGSVDVHVLALLEELSSALFGGFIGLVGVDGSRDRSTLPLSMIVSIRISDSSYSWSSCIGSVGYSCSTMFGLPRSSSTTLLS